MRRVREELGSLRQDCQQHAHPQHSSDAARQRVVAHHVGARDAGAKGDAAAGGDDGEFADVLTKLQGEDAPRTDALTDEQQQDMEQHAADGGAGRSTIDAMLGSLAGGDQQQNPTPAATPAANPVNDIIAAAVAFAPIQPASTRQSEGGAPTQTQTETQTQAQEPQPASKLALLDETVASGAPNQPDAMVDRDLLVYFMSIEGCKFRRKVVPGDVLELHMDVKRGGGRIWKFAGRATVDGALACEAEITAMMDLRD